MGLALICSAYGFVIQPIAQKHTSPENAGFAFAIQPVSSAIFASLFLHEILNVQEYIGAVLILFSLFISYNGTINIFNKAQIKIKKCIKIS